ncbi:hypothetical protein EDEG_01006 [Edhazardia aedis USNM 41457]|uniref:Uncharacterized protein n=1 Tax=Edhazardia aedis (strain USNM 41457) TaxID=1003232 RepID=J9DBB6_EDHAE|nr:hypothetical protein EDEG_01006 [Edhazardia aedis USNM 41457]|eukprot:EJW04784.1 hypothetical protein EDEG_01006 [Edhazardia aedis USNM 41457]
MVERPSSASRLIRLSICRNTFILFKRHLNRVNIKFTSLKSFLVIYNYQSYFNQNLLNFKSKKNLFNLNNFMPKKVIKNHQLESEMSNTTKNVLFILRYEKTNLL